MNLEEAGLSQQTRRHVLITLGACYRWLKKDRVVSLNPVDEVEPIPVPEPTPAGLIDAVNRAFPGPPIHQREPQPSPDRPKDGPPSPEQEIEPVVH